MSLADVLSWTFMAIAVGSYLLGTIGRWSFDSKSYQWAQVTACSLAIATAILIHFIPYIVFNLFWMSIALTKLWKLQEAA